LSGSEFGLDHWAGIWRQGMLDNIQARDGLDCTQYWRTREEAVQFDQDSRVKGKESVSFRMAQMNIMKGDRVLDIGAGTGALTIPISRIAADVTAIEPSENMLWCLRNNLSDEEITNVHCLQERWEDVDLEKDLEGPYDVVVASYSLGMIDIVGSLRKMNSISKRAVFLFWFAEKDLTMNDHAQLWSLLKGGTYKAKPQSDVLFNVLQQLGYEPHMDVTTTTSRRSYQSVEELVDEKASDLNVMDDENKRRIREYLLSRMVRIGDRYEMEYTHSSAVIWWRPTVGASCGH
jgi:ubiquinone/menaquinone biosynthesis C-methylase UbiE